MHGSAHSGRQRAERRDVMVSPVVLKEIRAQCVCYLRAKTRPAILLPSACRLTDNNRREQTRLVTNSATTSPSPVSEQRSPPTRLRTCQECLWPKGVRA